MANLSEEAKWESGIYQYETTDPLQGGADGIDNKQGKQLANRTQWLKKRIEATAARTETGTVAANAYAAGEQFFIEDKLYTATAEIAVGDEIKAGTNCAENGTLGAQLAAHEADKKNPHGVTAGQVGAYTKAETESLLADLYASARSDESKARNLLDVLGIRSVHSDDPATEAEAKACIEEMHKRLEAGDTSWYRDCDYLDLASITVDGTTYTWNAAYKNLRLMNMGLNVYKHAGDTENAKNHVVMQFRNCVLTRRMNATNTNEGGYPESELRGWLNDKFKTGLVAALGNYLYTVKRLLSEKDGWGWHGDTDFIPTEHEIWGTDVWSETWDGGF